MIPLERFLPQGEACANVIRQARDGSMIHALMITGEAGTGKWTLARGLAAALLCEGTQGREKPCGVCEACREMEAMTHPDLTVLQLGAPLAPTETKTRIPVTDVQAMIERISLHAYQGDRHVVIIRHAEDMTEPAQNKLLKTLEEPPEGTFFLLTCLNAEQMLTTIISRCRSLKLHPWGEKEILRALAENGFTDEKAREAARESGGSFGRALRIAGDEAYWQFRTEVIQDFLNCAGRSEIPRVSAKWKDRRDEADAIFTVLESFFSRMTRQTLGIEKMEAAGEIPARWRNFTRQAGPGDCARLMDAVALARRRLRSSVSFQPVMEQMILSFMEAPGT